MISIVFVLLATGCSNNSADMSAYKRVPKTNQFRTVDYESVTKALINNENGVYVVAHPGTYASLNIIPTLNDVLKDFGLEACYIDMSNEAAFTTDVNRRITEYLKHEDIPDEAMNFRPLIIFINDESHKIFLPEDTAIDFNQQELTVDDRSLLRTDIEQAVFGVLK